MAFMHRLGSTRIQVVLALLLLVPGAAVGQSAAGSDMPDGVQVTQPGRAFGYFIGDMLVQRVTATSAIVAGPAFEEGLRVDDYLYRLPVERSEAATDGVELRFQIINAPRATRTISLPATRLATASGEDIVLAPWSFTVSPLAARGATPGELVPDRSPLAAIAVPDSGLLLRTLAALGVVAALWLGWWLYRRIRDAHVMPFARARRAISRLPGSDRATGAQAWVALHHAFNAVAGRTVGATSVAQVFEAAPWLSASRDQIAQFFAESDQRFFQQTQADELHGDGVDVAQLCDSLYRLEKRHAAGPGA